MIIYKLTNRMNGMMYVGQTIFTVESRWRQHCKCAQSGANALISRAIVKYGPNNFDREIIQVCSSKDELNDREVYWVKTLNTKTPNGYNLTDGGKGNSGYQVSEETRQKLKYKKTEEHNKKISETIAGTKWMNNSVTQESKQVQPEEINKLLSEGWVIGRGKKFSETITGSGNHQFGKPSWIKGLTKETDGRLREYGKKISLAKIGKNMPAKFCKEQSERYTGCGHPLYGKCFVYNFETNERKMINKDELDVYINSGWIKYRNRKKV